MICSAKKCLKIENSNCFLNLAKKPRILFKIQEISPTRSQKQLFQPRLETQSKTSDTTTKKTWQMASKNPQPSA